MEGLEALACRAGQGPMTLTDWTWGEVVAFLEGREEERRQLFQSLSVIAYQGAWLTAGALAGETPPPVYERFPFWTQEEQQALERARYRQMMEALARRKRKVKT